jgi:hypothetical protein
MVDEAHQCIEGLEDEQEASQVSMPWWHFDFQQQRRPLTDVGWVLTPFVTASQTPQIPQSIADADVSMYSTSRVQTQEEQAKERTHVMLNVFAPLRAKTDIFALCSRSRSQKWTRESKVWPRCVHRFISIDVSDVSDVSKRRSQ